MIMMIFPFLIAALMIISYWIVFNKAGQPGWAILIPIYNIIVMLNVAKKPWWWIFLFLIPIVNIIFGIMMLNGISKNFGKSEGFTVGLIFLSVIFWPILA
ncbi:MAG: DUF5684 domain-containing protein, partial [Saprospiraceae bacterium]|nr:DUF5684 domain-containing protein [Saprospiraceae bacterium]